MPSPELDDVLDLLRSVDLGDMTLAEQRAWLEAQSDPSPEGVEWQEVDAGGVNCEWVTADGTDATRTILSLGGGGYCLGSLATNRRFSALLSEYGRARVLNVGYRRAPEHAFPAALDDAVAAYRWLVDGNAAGRVLVAGNSAGGGLALAVLLAIRDSGDPIPTLAGAIALSPWTDLANTGTSMVTNSSTEVMLDPGQIDGTAALYAPADLLRSPYVSPLYGRLEGLPPLLLQASETEILRDDSVRFAEAARRAGVDVTLELAPGMPHVWHLLAGLLPEADQAWDGIAAWVDRVLAEVH